MSVGKATATAGWKDTMQLIECSECGCQICKEGFDNKTMTRYCYGDFETFASIDIKTVGAANYLEHHETGINCFGYVLEGAYLAKPDSLSLEDNPELYAAACDPSVIFVFHNAAFDMKVWNEMMVPLGYPELTIDRVKCTMAKCHAHGLPGQLAVACTLLGITGKDMEGRKSMLKLAKPRYWDCWICGKEKKQCHYDATPIFWQYEDSPEDFEAMYAYCQQDITAMIGLDNELRDLTPYETRIWQIYYQMNTNGIHIDTSIVKKAIEIRDWKAKDANILFEQITGLGCNQRGKFDEWLIEHGVYLPDLQAHTRTKFLAEQLKDSDVYSAMEIYDEQAKSSLAKLDVMLDMCNLDGILREYAVYHGTHTGRGSSRGVQLYNLPRSTMDIPTICKALRTLSKESFEFLYPDVTTALSFSIRGMFVPGEGKRFLQADFSQGEARGVAWLAEQTNIVEAFANGEDVYVQQAAMLLDKPESEVDKEERQIGKVSVLQLGYQSGIAGVVKGCKQYGVDIAKLKDIIFPTCTPEEIRMGRFCNTIYLTNCKKENIIPVDERTAIACDTVKQRWRKANPMIVQFWADLESAAIEAVRTKKPIKVGLITFFTHKKFLCIKLPSGRILSYLYPKLKAKKGFNGEDAPAGQLTLCYRGRKGFEDCYGGKWAENITQALVGDLQREAMIRCAEKYPICLEVYDEMLAAVPIGEGSLEEFIGLMKTPPESGWAEGLPIDASGWEGFCFDKR